MSAPHTRRAVRRKPLGRTIMRHWRGDHIALSSAVCAGGGHDGEIGQAAQDRRCRRSRHVIKFILKRRPVRAHEAGPGSQLGRGGEKKAGARPPQVSGSRHRAANGLVFDRRVAQRQVWNRSAAERPVTPSGLLPAPARAKRHRSMILPRQCRHRTLAPGVKALAKHVDTRGPTGIGDRHDLVIGLGCRRFRLLTPKTLVEGRRIRLRLGTAVPVTSRT